MRLLVLCCCVVLHRARVVDAEIEFFADASGKIDRLILYQGGREMKGVKQ
jgi:hypothetical protein